MGHPDTEEASSSSSSSSFCFRPPGRAPESDGLKRRARHASAPSSLAPSPPPASSTPPRGSGPWRSQDLPTPGRARSPEKAPPQPAGQSCVDPLRLGFRRETWSRPRRWSVLSPWGVVRLVLHLLPALALHHHCPPLAVTAAVVSSGEGCSDRLLLVSPPRAQSSLLSPLCSTHGLPAGHVRAS